MRHNPPNNEVSAKKCNLNWEIETTEMTFHPVSQYNRVHILYETFLDHTILFFTSKYSSSCSSIYSENLLILMLSLANLLP